MRRLTTALFLAATLLVPALAFAHGDKAINDTDKDFLNKAFQGNLAEVKLGEIAQKNGQSAEVKSFGKKMVTDHTKAVDQIKALAAKKNVTLPTEINADDQKKCDELEKLSGADFDKTYMDEMVKDHDQDVAEFQNEAKTAKDRDVRNLTNKLLPTLKNHQKMAHAGGMKKSM